MLFCPMLNKDFNNNNNNKHILKDIVPRGFDARTEEIQEKYWQTIEEKDVAIALLAGDLQDRGNQIQAIQYENLGLQSKIWAAKIKISI